VTALLGLLGQDSVNRCPTHAEGVGNRARRFATGVHPLRQSGFRLVQRPGSPNRLAACPPGFPRCSTPFAAQLKFELRQAGESSGHHAPRCVRAVDAFA